MTKIKSVKLEATVFTPGDYPVPKEKEVAFLGRSNVGKSSLLNKIFGRKLAHTSSNPGKTRSINFFTVNNRFYFVDLPGYGYARASKKEIQRWQKLIIDYFEKRKSLNLAVMLIDGRHPLQKKDLEMLEWLKTYSVPFIVAETKIDKLSRSERFRINKLHEEELIQWDSPLLVPVSAKTGEGINKLLGIIV
ncbi:MAG: YihA family ribosome biogenesis GTP-binding protein [Kosmotoga sp.]|nr:MAG: YihA family ribosome biogenesis GTP-binding protein [Kosmotoga sp.]